MSDIVAKLSATAESYGLTVEVLNQMDPLYKSKNLPQIALLTEIWKSNMPYYSGYKPEYLSEYTEPIAIGGGTYAKSINNCIAFGCEIPGDDTHIHDADECLKIDSLLN